MFTGLVESTGRIRAMENRGEQARLVVEIPFAAELEEGESVAVNGVCLTAVEHDAASACFDVLRQTLAVTSLGALVEGSQVNLERALRAGDRFGGHFVQGHVDGTGIIEQLEPSGQDHRLAIRLPADLTRFCIDKGSLCIDGISLTIAEISDDLATFWIIPHTYERTNLRQRRTGDRVNLEADVIAKHVAKLLGR